ncbi:unnamed protein product [Dicrocoelium dendriticum]|nr:unnamed protein product [Dicrocoelium dendriticum]
MYINYLEKLFHLCGFVPERDVLRIPSTRRICIVGRKFHSTSQTERLAKIEQIVEAEKVAASATTFVPRDATEPVLNCTQLPLDVKRSVCDLVFTALLSQPPDEPELRMWNLTVSDDGRIRTTDGRWWNPGGHLSLSEITKMIPQEHLAAMKTQHGGLQTLLRNHYQAFNVVGGSVRLRWLPEKIAKPNVVIPAIQRPTVKSAKRKTKPCWMFTNHPDGCPYSEAECDFVHATIEN